MRLLLFILICPLAGLSQSEWEQVEPQVFMDLIRAYEQSVAANESYSLETAYRIYNDYKDVQPAQSFEGKLICRGGKELNVSQMGQLMIQDASVNISLDTAARQLLVQKADPSFFYRKTVQDYSTFLEMTEVVYRKAMSNKTVFQLQLKKGGPYHSMEFTFSDKNFISQIVIYSNQPYYEEGDTYSGAKAKIVLDFKNFKKGKTVDFSHFRTVKECIQMKDNQLIPVGAYKDFEVIDLRN
ncbi:hypothetical protein [Fluviicola sp.]|uniref:hypothetical protein n=1 Tax=Fluviicola sp. TaxID=1917219 RepID=UPI0031D1F436